MTGVLVSLILKSFLMADIQEPISFGDSLSLTEAIAIAEEHSYPILIYKKDIAQAKTDTQIARAAIGPRANVSSTFSFINASTSSEFGLNGSSTNTNIQLALSQIIDITGLYRDRIKAADYQLLATKEGLGTVKNDVKNRVRVAYLQALQARELVLVQESALKANQARLETAKVRLAEGAIAEFDVIRFQAQVSQSEQALTEANGNYQIALQKLNQEMGIPTDTAYELEPEVAHPENETAVNLLIQYAQEERPEVNQVNAAIDALHSLSSAASKEALPTLSVGAQHTRNLDPTFGQANSSSGAQITLTIPIVTGGLVAANTKAAEEREAKAILQLQQLKSAISFEVRAAYTQFLTAQESYATALVNRDLAKEALRLAELRYAEGVGIQLDVITGQSDLTGAEAAVANATFALRVAYANLQRAVGADNLANLPPTTPDPDPSKAGSTSSNKKDNHA